MTNNHLLLIIYARTCFVMGREFKKYRDFRIIVKKE